MVRNTAGVHSAHFSPLTTYPSPLTSPAFPLAIPRRATFTKGGTLDGLRR